MSHFDENDPEYLSMQEFKKHFLAEKAARLEAAKATVKAKAAKEALDAYDPNDPSTYAPNPENRPSTAPAPAPEPVHPYPVPTDYKTLMRNPNAVGYWIKTNPGLVAQLRNESKTKGAK